MCSETMYSTKHLKYVHLLSDHTDANSNIYQSTFQLCTVVESCI